MCDFAKGYFGFTCIEGAIIVLKIMMLPQYILSFSNQLYRPRVALFQPPPGFSNSWSATSITLPYTCKDSRTIVMILCFLLFFFENLQSLNPQPIPTSLKVKNLLFKEKVNFS